MVGSRIPQSIMVVDPLTRKIYFQDEGGSVPESASVPAPVRDSHQVPILQGGLKDVVFFPRKTTTLVRSSPKEMRKLFDLLARHPENASLKVTAFGLHPEEAPDTSWNLFGPGAKQDIQKAFPEFDIQEGTQGKIDNGCLKSMLGALLSVLIKGKQDLILCRMDAFQGRNQLWGTLLSRLESYLRRGTTALVLIAPSAPPEPETLISENMELTEFSLPTTFQSRVTRFWEMEGEALHVVKDKFSDAAGSIFRL